MYSRFYPYHEESDEYPEHMAVDFRKLRVSRLRDGRRGGIRASSRPAQRLRPLSPASGAERARRAPSSACARPVAARRRKARGRLPRRGPRGGRLACSWARAVEAAAECRPPWGAARSRGCAAGFPANAHAVVQVKALQRPGWGGSRGLYELVGRRCSRIARRNPSPDCSHRRLRLWSSTARSSTSPSSTTTQGWPSPWPATLRPLWTSKKMNASLAS